MADDLKPNGLDGNRTSFGTQFSSASGTGNGGGGIPIEPLNIPAGATEPAKRGPGRPRKDSGPAGSSSGATAGASTTRTGSAKAALDLETLADLIEAVHDIAGTMVHPDIKLDRDECMNLAKKLLALQKYYPQVDLPGVVLAWVNLGVTVSQVYGPRLGAVMIGKPKKKTGPLGPVSMDSFIKP